jgi:hypothetical protein
LPITHGWPGSVVEFQKVIERGWCEAGYNITRWTTMPGGGHFAAFDSRNYTSTT